jgi:thiamine transporter ThiT
MSIARRVVLGTWEFVVGDDWRTAVGVAVALGVTAVIATTDVAAWWIMPLAVLAILALSLRRGVREVSRRG